MCVHTASLASSYTETLGSHIHFVTVSMHCDRELHGHRPRVCKHRILFSNRRTSFCQGQSKMIQITECVTTRRHELFLIGRLPNPWAGQAVKLEILMPARSASTVGRDRHALEPGGPEATARDVAKVGSSGAASTKPIQPTTPTQNGLAPSR